MRYWDSHGYDQTNPSSNSRNTMKYIEIPWEGPASASFLGNQGWGAKLGCQGLGETMWNHLKSPAHSLERLPWNLYSIPKIIQIYQTLVDVASGPPEKTTIQLAWPAATNPLRRPPQVRSGPWCFCWLWIFLFCVKAGAGVWKWGIQHLRPGGRYES